MLKRKIYDKLLDWKNRKSRECLLVQGARQIGKTFIIEEFGRREYESYVYLNFYRNPEHKRIFEGSLEADFLSKKPRSAWMAEGVRPTAQRYSSKSREYISMDRS